MVVNPMSDERINKIWKLDENGGVSEEYLKELKSIQKSIDENLQRLKEVIEE